jgi:hypothetical protein
VLHSLVSALEALIALGNLAAEPTSQTPVLAEYLNENNHMRRSDGAAFISL